MTLAQYRIRNRLCIICGQSDKYTKAKMHYCAKCDAMLKRNKPGHGKEGAPHA